jgi:hypothetical protein
LQIFENLNGTSFGPPQSTPAGLALDLLALDADGDGLQDLALLAIETVWLFRGQGGLAVDAGSQYCSGFVGSNRADLDVADLEGDGDPDLVATNSDGLTVTMLENRGDGTFHTVEQRELLQAPRSLVSSDLDGDSTPEILAVSSDGLVVWEDAAIGGADSFLPLGNLTDVKASDLDADGDHDVLTSNSGSARLDVLLNQGGGVLGPPLGYPTSGSPGRLVSGDIDGDGDAGVEPWPPAAGGSCSTRALVPGLPA